MAMSGAISLDLVWYPEELSVVSMLDLTANLFFFLRGECCRFERDWDRVCNRT